MDFVFFVGLIPAASIHKALFFITRLLIIFLSGSLFNFLILKELKLSTVFYIAISDFSRDKIESIDGICFQFIPFVIE